MNSALESAYWHHVQGDLRNAYPYYVAGLKASPEATASWYSLAALLNDREQFDAAIVCARRAVLLSPTDPEALKALGSVLYHDERYDEAKVWLDKAADIAPGRGDIELSRGLVAYAQGDLETSIDLLYTAADRAPDPKVRYYALQRLVESLFANGEYKVGLSIFEESEEFDEFYSQAWRLGAPLWRGEPIRDKHVLVHHAGGVGDTLQFARYIPELVSRCWRVTFAIPAELMPVFKGVLHGCHLLEIEGPLPVPDYHTPSTWYFRHLPIEVPGKFWPYESKYDEVELPAPPGTRLKVGLIWRSRHANHLLTRRSTSLELLLPLAAIPGVALYGLQVGEAAADIDKFGADTLVEDLSPRIRDWRDTVSYFKAMDIIVSIDSGPLHLAGALGCPTIGLLPYMPDWRWGFGDRTPWYPSIKLFRQSSPGEWSGPIESAIKVIEGLLCPTN